MFIKAYVQESKGLTGLKETAEEWAAHDMWAYSYVCRYCGEHCLWMEPGSDAFGAGSRWVHSESWSPPGCKPTAKPVWMVY